MIGKLDVTNLLLWLPFNIWGKGNGTSDKNTGNMPSWQGLYQNCSIDNCGVGEGYVYNAGDAFFKPDGVNNRIQTGYNQQWTNASKWTVEYWINRNAGTNSNLGLPFDDANNYTNFWINAANKLHLTFANGGVLDYAKSTDTVLGGVRHVAGRKNGATLQLFIGGSEVAAYDNQDPYGLGTYSLAADYLMGGPTGLVQLNDDIFDLRIWNDAISDARIANNAAIGRDSGLIGNNVGDTMNITAPGAAIPIFSKKLIQRG
jgi:hypothetical protein